MKGAVRYCTTLRDWKRGWDHGGALEGGSDYQEKTTARRRDGMSSTAMLSTYLEDGTSSSSNILYGLCDSWKHQVEAAVCRLYET